MECASCEREIPDEGIVCPYCNDAAPEPAAGYRELRREARSLRGWLILSLLFGIVTAPFAIWRATAALTRFRGAAAAEDPASYRQLVIMRRLAVALLALWALLLAGHFGLEWFVGDPPVEALVHEAVLADVLDRCACPAFTLEIESGDTAPYLAQGRNIAEPGKGNVIVRLGSVHFYSENKAAVAAQLRAPRSYPSFGATYELQRDSSGRWSIYYRTESWKS